MIRRRHCLSAAVAAIAAPMALRVQAQKRVPVVGFLEPDNVPNFGHRARIAEFAARERLPDLHAFAQAGEAGALVAYGVNIRELDHRLALHVDKILKGAKPGELPIERPASLDLVVNLKTARAIGLVMPQELLLSAQQVIE